MQRLQRSNRRCALVCPEDNIATLLLDALRAAKISCPERTGILSVMGKDYATKAGLSCIRDDFRKLGRFAVAALGSKQPVRHQLESQFIAGRTT